LTPLTGSAHESDADRVLKTARVHRHRWLDGAGTSDEVTRMKTYGERGKLVPKQFATERILVGDDARALDEAVRADPEGAYGEHGLNLSTITGQ
jgi:hypothetical protein